MIRFSVLLIHVAAIVSISLQVSPEEAKQAIEAARKDAEKWLIDWQPLVKEILDSLVAKLRDLEKGGKDSIDYMVSYKGPGDKKKAIDSSINFWKDKMVKIVESYINKKGYKDPLPDSDPLEGKYRRVDEEAKKVVEEAVSAFRKEYDRVTGQPPATVEDVAKSTWKKVAADWPLSKTIVEIRRWQYNIRKNIKDWDERLMKDLKAVENA